MGYVLCCHTTQTVYLMSYTHNSSAQYKPQSSGFFAKSSGVQFTESKRLCSATSDCLPGSELPRVFYYHCILGAVGRKCPGSFF